MNSILAVEYSKNPLSNEGGKPVLSVIIPVLNDAHRLCELLPELSLLQDTEILIVDGGSTDDLPVVAARYGLPVLPAQQGRGQQLAVGVAASRADWIWFLHADSRLETQRAQQCIVGQKPGWGRFHVRIEGQKLVSWFMNQRSCISGICTGDQGMYVHRQWLSLAGGMPEQSLMEDIELSKRLRRLGRPECLRESVSTDGKRWRERGTVRCILEMWWLRFQYFLGADPEQLASTYYRPQP